MRRFPLTAALVALACAACSKETAKAPPPVEAPSAALVVETPPPAPAAPEAVETATAPEAAPAPSASAVTSPAPRPERVVRVVPARERRIHALVNNAISRDVTGATEHDAAMWEARRAACKTQACVDRAYAAQETELRKWEGSEDIR